ncbi:MAG: nicotinate-nucleotide--dimethylbenzimidazole phosphoribosyltransferase [Bacillota bacterium]|nr:nicotinate-nucleotide--dimethylbenzimidazole phosphoribosyltransferase [Bacillota bacterium]
MDKTITEILDRIRPADAAAIEQARKRQASLAKPPGSLGLLEEISIRVAGITGNITNNIDKGCVAVFCADNGVACEGVSSAPQSVTMAQTVNFTRRLTGVGALAKCFDSELLIVDMGVRDGIPEELYLSEPFENDDTHKIVNRRIRPETGQTDNIAKGPAMSREEAIRCIETGLEMADAIAAKGFDIMGVGEMGIGNTTTSAAILSAITGEDAEVTVGRGGGVNDEGLRRKKEIVNQVSETFRREGGILQGSDAGRRERMIEALAAIGGFDICAMTGAFLGAAKNRMPVVIDGYISVVAALAASVIAPEARDYMIASHKSYEIGYKTATEVLGIEPFLSLDMRLGEGSGCPITFEVVRGACAVMTDMATFEEAAINDGYLEEIRSTEKFQR